MKKEFTLQSEYTPAGDQPEAIRSLVQGLEKGNKKQTLLGVTGSGKTFTMANIIQSQQKPTLVIAHNKTLAAQLAQEFKEFFPDNIVHYFVSYYDYYQPEAYVVASDTYIEKDATINEEIDRLRHASTQSLLTRSDVIIVASVSCIYGLGSPEDYEGGILAYSLDQKITKTELMKSLINLRFERKVGDLTPGSFRSIGTIVEVMPTNEKVMYSIEIMAGSIVAIDAIDPISHSHLEEIEQAFFFPAKHFVTSGEKVEKALVSITNELKNQLEFFEKEGKVLESDRLKRRANYDLAMIRELGYCSGIENYSRHMSGKKPGEAPDTLLEYFPRDKDGNADFLTIIDESHVTVPQIRAMYNGDQARKQSLVDHGFRLPSAKDNRPLRFEEFEKRVSQQIYVSATPSAYEIEESENVAEQIIRPTGLLDPIIIQKGVRENKEENYPGQIADFISDAEKEISEGGRVLATTLTKKMAEDLSEYLKDKNIKAEYLHSDVKTMDRIRIISEFRKGDFDILIGVNLLREGLDMPEVTLIGILDADKAGFLRSKTSLIQTIGRAARNDRGRVTVYADHMTEALEYAISETARRRKIQSDYNKKNGITPKTIRKAIKDITEHLQSEHAKTVIRELHDDLEAFGGNVKKLIKYKKKAMEDAAKKLDFERAAILRDELLELEHREGKKEEGTDTGVK